VLGLWFDFIRLDDLSRRLVLPGDRPFYRLSFDDGKRSNYTAVGPESHSRGVPAVFMQTPSPFRPAMYFGSAGLELSALNAMSFEQLIGEGNASVCRPGVLLNS
jgi:hypothetical protein